MGVRSAVLIAGALLLSAAACTTPSSATLYSRGETRNAWHVVHGRVADVAPIRIEGQKTWLGTAGGGYVGYELGRAVGHGTGSDIAGAVGSVVGAVAGQAVEEAATRQPGLLITVELDNGETIAVAQAGDLEFAPGERVKVLRGHGGAARVTRL